MKKLILVLLAIIIVLFVYFILKNKRQSLVNTNPTHISSMENPTTHEPNSKDQREQLITSIKNERSKKPEDIFSDSEFIPRPINSPDRRKIGNVIFHKIYCYVIRI